jgi:hypothetical protein
MIGMVALVILVVFAMVYLINLLTNVHALVELRLARRQIARRPGVARNRTAEPVDGAISLDELLQELHAA